ncbi:MAG: tetratricopeptide repeat protein, partial [Nannocystaceae bacterium]
LGVAKILEPAYRSNNQWPRLIQAYEIMVAHSENPEEKLGLLGEIARLQEITGDEQKAFEALGRGLRVDPAHEETQARLDNLARQMGAYAELVALYEEVIPDIVNDELVIAILFKVAQIQEQVLQDPEKAAASYERVMDIDPTNFDSVDYLIDLHRRNNNYEALVAAVVRKSEMVDNVDDRKSLVLYAADVREKIMEDPEGAIDLYQQVLAIDDTDATALDALQALYIQTENWDALKDVYRRKAELADDLEIRRQTLHALGAVFDQKLESVEQAIETYQSILDLESFDYAAIQCLDRLFGQAERWPDQLQILERAVEVTDNQLEQAEYRYRIGALWETELADPVRAVESYSEVLRFAHDHAATIEALDRIVHGDTEPMLAAEVLAPLYEQLTEWEKLVDIYDVMATHTEDPPEKIERLHMVAAIYERQLSLFDKAFEALARALAVDSTHETTIAELNRLADLTGEYDRLAKLLAERAEDVLDPMVKIDMLLRQARVQEEKLNNVDNAIARYLEVLDSDPEHREAIAALDRVFTHLERWPELVENLRRQMLTAEDEEQSIETQFRMGQIYQMSMGDLSHAIEAYREILNINPDHSPTLTALELIFEEGEHQAEIAEILEPLYYAAERWTSLVKLSEVKLESTEHPQDKLEIIRNVGELCERRLGDAGQAFYWWLRAYMVDPTSEDVTEQLERLADITQEWGYIVEVSDQILENEGLEPEVRRQVLSRAGRVLDEHIQDPARAIDAYCKVLEINPENIEALEALDRIYSQTSMWEELVDILRRRIQATMDTELLIDLEMRLAGTYEQYLADPEEAIAAYNRAIEVEPSNLRALEALEALFLSHYRWDELFNTYQKMVDVANTDEDMAGCYQRMAKLASETLDRELDSVDLWNRVLDLRGEDPLALNELATLHEREARWDDLAEVLERLVYAIEDSNHKVAVFQRLGKVYGDKLEKPRNALDSWLNALEVNDRDLETLTALHRIYEESESWMELVDTLMRLISLGEAQLGR